MISIFLSLLVLLPLAGIGGWTLLYALPPAPPEISLEIFSIE
jgi:hypothetical protein